MLVMTQTVSMTPNNSCISPFNPLLLLSTDAGKARLVNKSVLHSREVTGPNSKCHKEIVDLLALSWVALALVVGGV